MFKIDVCKVCGVNCFWIEGIDGDLAEKEVCTPECLVQLAVCPTPRALDVCPVCHDDKTYFDNETNLETCVGCGTRQ